jgi:hypothetical protein
MFEHYTEQARRVVFFARYEAALLGSPSITSAHLLLGLLREDKGPVVPILRRRGITHKSASAAFTARSDAPPGSTSVDIPLAADAKAALGHAAEESERLRSEAIDVEHVLLGLMRDPESAAAELLRRGVLTLDAVREELGLLARATEPPGPVAAFPRLVELLATLDKRHAAYHVSRAAGDGVRVEVTVPEERWVATFLPDGRIAVETFTVSARDQGEAALARLLERLGPAQTTLDRGPTWRMASCGRSWSACSRRSRRTRSSRRPLPA